MISYGGTDEMDIIVPYGDTGDVTISFSSDDYAEGTILFTVKKTTSPTMSPIIEKTLVPDDGKLVIHLSNQDTRHQVGDYYWDLRCKHEDGNVDTLMTPHLFTITRVVGNVVVDG